MYRDYDDPYWEWETAPSIDASAWDEWDYILARVIQLIEDYTDKQTGQLYWVDQSEKVDWDVRSTFSASQAALDAEMKTRGDAGLEPGENLYAVPVLRNQDEPPTLSEWLKELEEDALRPHGSPNTGFDENDIEDAREARARKKQEMLEKLKSGT